MQSRAVLLGSAALMIPGVGAVGAADLPSVEPVEHVRICDAFGAGFFYIPSADTCLKLGGYVRAESHFVDGDPDVLRSDGTPEQSNANFNNWTSRARANVSFDTQTNSGFGLIRAYLEFEATIGPSDYDPDYSDSRSEASAAFIQVTNDFGEFTAGHAGSFFDFYSSDDYGTRVDIDDNTTEQTLFAYTLVGPHGLRGTISVEDPKSSGRRLTGADDYEGSGTARPRRERKSGAGMGLRTDHGNRPPHPRHRRPR